MYLEVILPKCTITSHTLASSNVWTYGIGNALIRQVEIEIGGQLIDQDTIVNDSRCQYIYSYSFALSPEEHQPSGTCNFSRIDNAILQLTYGADSTTNDEAVTAAMNLSIYGINYNVLRIMSGMGGLAYSN